MKRDCSTHRETQPFTAVKSKPHALTAKNLTLRLSLRPNPSPSSPNHIKSTTQTSQRDAVTQFHKILMFNIEENQFAPLSL